MAAATRYWVVSLPVQSSASSTWSRLQEAISKQSFDTPVYRFNTPDLRVGTLDSLLSLSDDLLKSNSFIEGVSHKIRRQVEELERVSGIEGSPLTVEGVPVDSYLTRFVWDEAKYPIMSPLREIVDSIHVQVAKIEDDLKVRVAEYNNVRSQLNAINRKQSGSLAVRDLSNLVKPEDIITSEHLVTLLAVVPKYSQKQWLSQYETLTTHVVPRSSKKLYEDNDYALYTVTLFGRVADNFKTSAREKGFQIRDFEYSPEAAESRKQELEKLMQDQDNMRSSLLQWCYASYGEALDGWYASVSKMVRHAYNMYKCAHLCRELTTNAVLHFLKVFISWMHFCAVRVFSESILRYGLPPAFLIRLQSKSLAIKVAHIFSVTRHKLILHNMAAVLAPSAKSEKKVRSILERLCDNTNSVYWKTEDDVGMAGLVGESDSHPYVSFTINFI